MRPSLDRTLLDVAAVMARRSTCARLQVGAVLAREGRVLSTGYNGTASGLPHCVCGPESPCGNTVHAEANAVAFAARHGVSALGSTLYVTHAPCADCAGLLVNCGIAAVVYRDPYRSRTGLDWLWAAGVHIIAEWETEE